MLNGIHVIAGLRRVFGDVETIYMQEHKNPSFPRADLEGTMTGLLTMTSGIHVTILQSAETRFRGATGGYLIHGERGSIRASNQGYELLMDGEDPVLRPYPTKELSSYARELEAFACYVAGDDSAPTTGASERRTLAVIQAGYESAPSGHAVNLTQRFGAL